ncbi:hypothetical protein IMZ11_11515 [Microtetraspora sp. AC03309]|uniref:hypothetical protein n=1 Tax=Microtetraspora sp. AC03309 TaxID=2779376 RepID=UPI001E3345E7|nr:hypothetical protein [Microtetraspora sp. AC03309]MCC5576260.1 hypothetical protein [Microtetraspora sp. AC03309]
MSDGRTVVSVYGMGASDRFAVTAVSYLRMAATRYPDSRAPDPVAHTDPIGSRVMSSPVRYGSAEAGGRTGSVTIRTSTCARSTTRT